MARRSVDPTVPQNGRATEPPRARAKATRADGQALIERLDAAPDKTLRLVEPSEADRAAYRAAIHAAKHHKLVPQGTLLRHTGRSSGDLIIRLLDAEAPDETDWNRIRLNLRKPETAEETLHQQLVVNPAAIAVSESHHARAVAFLVKLNAAAANQDQSVILRRRGKYAKLGYLVEDRPWTLILVEDKESGASDPDPRLWHMRRDEHATSGRLRLLIDHRDYLDGTSAMRPLTWAEEPGGTLETRIPKIFSDISRRRKEIAEHAEAVDRQAKLHQQALERAQHDWAAAKAAAVPRAVDALRHRTLVAALNAWRDARDLREICSILEARATEAKSLGQHSTAENLEQWRDAGLTLADRLDPTKAPASLADVDFDAITPSREDLRPYLDGRDPDYLPPNTTHDPKRRKPWPEDWDLARN
jgi:hypothetical protein